MRKKFHNLNFLEMEKKDEKKVATVATTPKTAELKNASAELKKAEEPKRAEKAQTIKEILEAQLREITRKKQLADHREVFVLKRNELKDLLKQLKQQTASGTFESEDFRLTFTTKSNYRDTESFRISNPEMLTKFVVFLEDEIGRAIERIEKELLQDVA